MQQPCDSLRLWLECITNCVKTGLRDALWGYGDEERLSRGHTRLHKDPDSEDRAGPREELTQATGDRL